MTSRVGPNEDYAQKMSSGTNELLTFLMICVYCYKYVVTRFGMVHCKPNQLYKFPLVAAISNRVYAGAIGNRVYAGAIGNRGYEIGRTFDYRAIRTNRAACRTLLPHTSICATLLHARTYLRRFPPHPTPDARLPGLTRSTRHDPHSDYSQLPHALTG